MFNRILLLALIVVAVNSEIASKNKVYMKNNYIYRLDLFNVFAIRQNHGWPSINFSKLFGHAIEDHLKDPVIVRNP